MQEQWDAAMEAYRETDKLARRADHPTLSRESPPGSDEGRVHGPEEPRGRRLRLPSRPSAPARRSRSGSISSRRSTSGGSIQVAQGDLIGGGDTLNRALTLAEGLDDRALVAYAYVDRGEVYQKLGEKCDYQRIFAPCYEALGLARAGLRRAWRSSRGWAGRVLLKVTRESLESLELRRKLLETHGEGPESADHDGDLQPQEGQ